ncbi:MAG TPA: helix-turn-helix domain-containing protein [Steroidobacteraceae bacterium]|nr:helix-turn-helix domain-containing protein [Steroidobacteraceae bacterium]
MAKAKTRKRSQGRPSGNAVGRAAVLEAARKLLHDLPPARVTMSAVAREVGIDPALVRYYFGDRDNLLLAVVDLMLAGVQHRAPADADPLAEMERRIRETLAFTRSAKQMNRLMIDELAQSRSPQVRQRQRAMNIAAAEAIGKLLDRDPGATFNRVDPLFLHLALIGIFDFFVLAQPLILNLVPEGTDMQRFERRFEDFVVRLLMDGLRKR